MDGVAATVRRRNIANRVVAAVSGSYARLQFITAMRLAANGFGSTGERIRESIR
jgi:hypothetical protein